jgi:hypothetical protein
VRFSTFLRETVAIAPLLVVGVVAARADSWAMPKDKEYSSANRELVFKVQPRRLRDADRQQCPGALSQRQFLFCVASTNDPFWDTFFGAENLPWKTSSRTF